MAVSKATTTSDTGSTVTGGGDELSGANLRTDADRATADLSVDNRKTADATLKGGTKISGPADVVAKLKNR
jgi:hypothetical protein